MGQGTARFLLLILVFIKMAIADISRRLSHISRPGIFCTMDGESAAPNPSYKGEMTYERML